MCCTFYRHHDCNSRKKYFHIRKNAYKLHKNAYDYIINSPHIKTVVLAHSPTCSYYDAIDRRNPHEKNSLKVLENGARRTFEILSKANKKILFVLDNPLLPHDPKYFISRPFRITDKEKYTSFPISNHKNNEIYREFNNLIITVSKDYPNVSTIDLSDILCDDKRCYAIKNNKLLYRDNNHLNYNSSLYVAPYIIEKIRSAQTK